MRVLFWGTPEFALPALEAAAAAGHEIVGVVTRPDRPRGRGRRSSASPVAILAERRGWRVLRPERPRGLEFVAALRRLEADVGLVVAYGRLLPTDALEAPRLGSLNAHASLLPKLRGAAPVAWAIARGHAVTGVTVMRMVAEMDAGPILAQERLRVGADETATELAGRLSRLAARAAARTLERLESGAPVVETPQDDALATWAPKVDRAAARVDWTRSAREVAARMRAMDRTPGAWTLLGDAPVKVFRPTVEERPDGDGAPAAPTPGEILLADPRRGLAVAAGAGVVRVGEVQLPGGRRMAAAAWARGAGPAPGARFR